MFEVLGKIQKASKYNKDIFDYIEEHQKPPAENNEDDHLHSNAIN